MGRLIGRRLLSLVPVLAVLAVVTFIIIHLTPGNPAEVILGNGATIGQINALTRQLGLDRPLVQQFGSWLVNVLHGNLGRSIFYDQPVLTVIGSHIMPTVYLSVLATLLSIVIALPIGVLAAWRERSWLDRFVTSGSILGVSIPSFWLAIMLVVVFAVALAWVPVSGYVAPSAGVGEWLMHLILPVVVLSAGQSALIARMLRDGMIESMKKPYIRSSRARGASEREVLLFHALPNAVIPTLTVIGNSLASLLSGVVVVEVVFDIPGLGNLIIQAIDNRDYPLIQGIVLVFALIYVAVNLLVDLSYPLLDPRLRHNG
ncbi:MAG: ABC transporter permease [Ferrimicrobium sp.]|jgi:peptide/nickel transport system permease protein|uniref:ABC transporter permease n=1 Tax=Ferrimicrobium acidiphilum TaxID=121039 RepID=A0ABV3Y7R2_9ACTN|nr:MULTISPECIES: ABC transporter permease [Ferrimicrobium]